MAKVLGISFCVLMCSLVVREHNKSFALILSVAGGILSFLTISDKVSELFSSLMSLSASVPSGVMYVKLMLKVLCIVIITQFTVDICRDNGENALASFTEVSAKVLVLSLVMPLFETVISMVVGLVK
mgnify:FL=1